MARLDVVELTSLKGSFTELVTTITTSYVTACYELVGELILAEVLGYNNF